jgi:REP element-mobilizing transposase RayT
MTYDPTKHHRRSIRLAGYDYARAGAYFVTICTQNRLSLFGEVVEDVMRPNDAGLMIAETWTALADRFPRVIPDTFIVMPNHFHGILFLCDVDDNGTVDRAPEDREPTRGAPTGDDVLVGAPLVGAHVTGTVDRAPTIEDRTPTRGVPTVGASITVGDVVGAFKSLTTLDYGRGVKARGWPRFIGTLWQRNYYEHIIRDEDSLEQIRAYMNDNPRRWAFDRDHPDLATRQRRNEPWSS